MGFGRECTVALIGLTSLEGIALRMLLSTHFGCRVVPVRTMQECHALAERPDLFIVSPEAALSSLDFLLPRRNRVAVVTRDSKIPDSAFIAIPSDATESVVIDRLSSLLASLAEEQPEVGELSQREKDVLREIAAGLTNKEIADRLYISVNTVITHRKNISTKLGIRSASGLSLYAVMNGLI